MAEIRDPKISPQQLADINMKDQMAKAQTFMRNQHAMATGQAVASILNVPCGFFPPGNEFQNHQLAILRRVLVTSSQNMGITITKAIFDLKRAWIAETEGRRKAARERKRQRAEAKEAALKEGTPPEVVERGLNLTFGPEEPEPTQADLAREAADDVLAAAVAEEERGANLTLVGPDGKPAN